MEFVIYSVCIIIVLILGLYFYKKRKKKKGLDGTDKPPEDIYPLY